MQERRPCIHKGCGTARQIFLPSLVACRPFGVIELPSRDDAVRDRFGRRGTLYDLPWRSIPPHVSNPAMNDVIPGIVVQRRQQPNESGEAIHPHLTPSGEVSRVVWFIPAREEPFARGISAPDRQNGEREPIGLLFRFYIFAAGFS